MAGSGEAPIPDWVARIIRARALVGMLGEASSPPWWPSKLTTPAGRTSLSQVFPRGGPLTAYRLVTRAASVHHDRMISHPHASHLFRLPPSTEAAITRAESSDPGKHLVVSLLDAGISLSLSALTDQLRDLAGAQSLAHATTRGCAGPVQVEPTSDEIPSMRARILRVVCATYVRALDTGSTVAPFLVVERKAQADQ